MTTLKKRALPLSFAVLTLCMFIAACGGGGGGGEGDNATQNVQNDASPSPAVKADPAPEPASPSSTPPVDTATTPHVPNLQPIDIPDQPTMTAATYVNAGTAVYTSLHSLVSYSDIADGFVTGIAVATSGPVGLSRRLIDMLMSTALQQQPMVTGIAYTIPCKSGGTMNVDATLQTLNRFSQGDTMSIHALKCRSEPDLAPLSGTVIFTFNEIDGALTRQGKWVATVGVQMKTLALSYAEEAVVINGDMTIKINQIDESNRTIRLSGAELSEDGRRELSAEIYASISRAGRTFTDYAAEGITRGTRSEWTVNYGLTNRLGLFESIKFKVRTLQPLVFEPGPHPVSGSILVNSTSSLLTLTALNADTARLDFSINGDGVVNETSDVPWSQLLLLPE